MGFLISKSIKAGPFRFNLSSRGVGLSVGVRGLRLGTGPRGHYIRAGLGGIHYQQSMKPAGATLRKRASSIPRSRPAQVVEPSGVVMREVESADAADMRDGSFRELLAELNQKQNQTRMAMAIPIAVVVLGVIGWFTVVSNPSLAAMRSVVPVVILAALSVGWVVGRWLDSYRRVTVLAYDLDDRVTRAYEDAAAAFEVLAGCGKKFRIDAGGTVNDLTTWKRNAGASHLLRTEPITLDHRLPGIVRSNVMPPALRSGGRTFYFLPDMVLISDRGGFGAVGYADLKIDMQPSRWIEEGAVPPDTETVGLTWQHPNKSGGPDRRFKENRQLPICLHDLLHLASQSGLNELLQFSRPGSVQPFRTALEKLPRQAIPAGPTAPLSSSRLQISGARST